ncbi:discoidin domain-containing protein [Paenibacillus sp. LHD-117]|uniref:discoidin domain-containing protein n=1 Tax=Paenibacillus sp. LHD-117 TaxID=3071412 RepID=UPI0027DF1EDF|nr:discoidin domain-containing protein [Paenibacillus sp. LHD-117]MDQ6420275.1 discoidin domain-containing protein [Paenibacillus sp. LHD-117]
MSKQLRFNKVNKGIRLAIAAAAIIAIVSVILLSGVWNGGGSKATFELNEEENRLVVGSDRYEIAFDAANGGIVYMKEQGKDGLLTVGNEALWWAILGDDSSVQSAQSESFSYEWEKDDRELAFHYGGAVAVDVAIRFGADDRIYMKASLANGTGQTIKSFRFPYELKLDQAGVRDAMLPMLPGAKLKPEFFRESNSFSDQYPGVMFASYLAMRTDEGSIAMYDLGVEKTPLTEIGYKHQINDSGKTSMVHNYKTWIEADERWTSPEIVLEIGGGYESSIASYRELNGIGEYRSLADKLGDDADKLFELPLYKTDISAIKDANWERLTSDFVEQMNYNGMIHLVGFQTGGHDENYPDFYPPDAIWGGEDKFLAFMKAAKENGNIVVPYTNMSWWGVNSPTLGRLPAGRDLADIMVEKENGTMMQEDYGPHSGYVANTGHPFFLERTAEEHRKLTEEAGFDGIFEDQWGIRNSPYVYNEAIPEGTDPSTAYFQGMRDYFDAAEHRMYIEDGTDVLADDSIGFMGSTYLWDLLGYRNKTASYTDYYPLSGMLMRDKVMFFHHNLAGETMTDDPDMLRWNLAMGYNLSADFYNGVTSPWVDAIGIFQKYVLSGYVDRLVQGFEQVTPTVTKTDFGTHQVTANWDKEAAHVLDPNRTLSPGGYHVEAEDGSVTAGNYSRYEAQDLDAGEHHLVEVRSGEAVRIYQPIGSDTTLRVKGIGKWKHAIAAAYEADGTKIADLQVKEDGEYVIFDYVALIKEKKVGYVELTGSDEPSAATETFPKVKLEVNQALGKPVTGTSLTAEAFDPKLSVDGDPFTYWESTAKKFPQSLTVDLGEEKSVSKIVLRLPPQDAWETRTQEIEVLGSADGETFATLLETAAYTYDPKTENKVELKLASTANARYIRVAITSNSAWPAAQVSEFEVY